MELRTIRESRHSAQIDKVMGKKTDTPAGAQTPQRKGPTDKLTLSRQAVAFVEEQSRKMWDEVREREQHRRDRMNAKPSDGELDLLGQGLKVLEMCEKIAASIIKGDNVPPEDLKFLMENDPDGYRLAMAMRRENPDPEEEESVLTDEDKNGGSNQGTGSVEAPSAEAPSVGASDPSGGASAATE